MVSRKSQWLAWRILRIFWRVCLYVTLFVGAALLMLPFLWMISSSLKTASSVYIFPPQWIPHPPQWRNYIDVLQIVPFGRFFLNSTIIVSINVFSITFTASLVGFGFARLRARARSILFVVLLATMMLPAQVTMIPQYMMYRWFHLVDTWGPLLIPGFFAGSAFYVFLFRQFFMTIPLELDDAARIDGCGAWSIYWQILLPLSKPAMITVAIFTFMGSWNDFYTPLVYLRTTSKFTVALGMNYLRTMGMGGKVFTHLLMAVSVMAVIPCLAIFFFAQKYFVQGVVLTGVEK